MQKQLFQGLASLIVTASVGTSQLLTQWYSIFLELKANGQGSSNTSGTINSTYLLPQHQVFQ